MCPPTAPAGLVLPRGVREAVVEREEGGWRGLELGGRRGDLEGIRTGRGRVEGIGRVEGGFGGVGS